MDKEYVGYILAIVGIALIAMGALNVAGYINFQVVDTTLPTILYTYPANGMTYKAGALNEIIIYAKDNSDVVSASYNDEYGLKTLTVTPYTKLYHPFVIQGWKYPDVNFDGRVDSIDYNLVISGKNAYNSTYDLNSDGKIDLADIYFVGKYVVTVTFAISITPSYSIGENVTFIFSALDTAGNPATISGWFSTADYQMLSGEWRIHGVTVTDNMMIVLSERKTTITFICNDTTISATDVTAKVTVENTAYTLSYNGNFIWQGTIELPSGESKLILEASTQSKMNKIAVTVSTPEAFTFTVGHGLMLSGGILLAVGVIIVLKKKEVEW